MDNYATRRESDDLDKTKAFEGLTPKQYTYAVARASGKGPTEAYREAYDPPGSSPATMGTNAWVVEQDTRVVKKIQELLNARLQTTTLVPLLNRNFVVEGIMQIAVKDSAKDNVRLHAYELLGKMIGIDLFRGTEQPEAKPRTPEDVDRELKEKFANMMQTIDGEAKRVDAPNPTPEPVQAKRPTLKPAVSPPRDRRRKPAS